jgi:dTMP kinase
LVKLFFKFTSEGAKGTPLTMEKIPSGLLRSFRPPVYPGSFFISLEGIEGSGKSTQIVKIKSYLEARNYRVLILREPGGTVFGEKLRSAILNTQTPIHPLAETYLFAASRAQLLCETTLQELAVPNTVIILDRYLDSSLVYQGFARDLGIKRILEIHQSFPLNLVPHLTFYLKISLESSIKRQQERGHERDYFESQDKRFHQKLIEGYDLVAEIFPERIVKLNAERSQDEIFNQISDHIDHLLIK